MRRSTLLALALLTVPVALAAPAAAKGGSGGGGGGGGGGTTTSVGAIREVRAAATCDSGTAMTVTLRKGFDKRVEAQIVPTAEGVDADGSPAGLAWWNQRLFNNTTGTQVGRWGGTQTMTPGLVGTILLGTVPVGTSNLTYTATRQTLTSTSLIDLDALANEPIVETCTATITVIGR